MITTDNILKTYINGETVVTIYSDGTKTRIVTRGTGIPDYPETMDMKITNYCDLYCLYCHEMSDKRGQHADVDLILHRTKGLANCEFAIGGGNPLSHPDLEAILEGLTAAGNICNITVNERHLVIPTNRTELQRYIDKGLIRGIGISLAKTPCFSNENTVAHVIAGVHSIDDIKAAIAYYEKVLILGYKFYGRGELLDAAGINKRIDQLKFDLWQLFRIKGATISFDNLAIKQLGVKKHFTEQGWDTFYMGDDGTYSMYYDAVNDTFAVSSTSERESCASHNNSAISYFQSIKHGNPV